MKTAEGYKLIPMSEITDEAREIAVAWMECEDKNWIGQKHKLASDIMNYAKKYSQQFRESESSKATGSAEAYIRETWGESWLKNDWQAGDVIDALEEFGKFREISDESLKKELLQFRNYFNDECYGSIEGWIVDEYLEYRKTKEK